MDDLSGKINELFSNPESMEKIRGLLGMLSNGAGTEENGAGAPAGENSPPPPPPPGNDLPFDPSMLLKLKGAMDLVKKDDPKISLLLALKPNLSGPRQQKVDEAIHLLRLINLMPVLREGHFL